jgi:hypothetical protein
LADPGATIDLVADPVGLGGFLKLLSDHRGKTIRDLKDALKNQGLAQWAKVVEIHQGVDYALTGNDLIKIASAYGDIRPMLLYPYLFPTEPDAVTVYDDSLRAIPKPFVDVPGLSYRVPIRRLALSDIDAMIVDLRANTATETNDHPGFELAMPLGDGEIEVVIEDSEVPLRAKGAEWGYCHYRSDKPHRVINTGSETVTVFDIRFHRPAGRTN